MRVRDRSAAHHMRDVHLAFMIGWSVMIPIAFWTGLIHSIVFCNVISLWALVATEAGAYQSGRTEVKGDIRGGSEG